MVKRFVFFLQGKSMVTNMEDRMWWRKVKDGIFFVRSFYSAMGVVVQSRSRLALYGALVFLLRLAFLLGKLLGVKL